jgi:DNA-binding transcriptional LysR family regulator
MLDAMTLDQMRMLIAIVDAGGFTAAARQVQRAQSAVSHAISTLEDQLDVPLFDRSTRKPQLTVAGRVLLEDARSVIARSERLKARARAISQGLESELLIAASAVVPTPALVAALDAFARQFPTVAVQLFVEEFGGAALLVREDVCSIGIVGSQSLDVLKRDEIEQRSVGTVAVVAVASSRHPLAQFGRPVTERDLEEHRQLTPTSRASVRYANTLSYDAWQVADLSSRYAMIKAGLGWGTVPESLAHADLVTGRVVRLNLASRSGEAMRVPIFAIYKASKPPGKAGQWFIDRLGNAAL